MQEISPRKWGSATRDAAGRRFLDACVVARLNILVSGRGDLMQKVLRQGVCLMTLALVAASAGMRRRRSRRVEQL